MRLAMRPRTGHTSMLARVVLAVVVLACLIPAAATAGPRGKTLNSGWQVRSQSAQPGEAQDAPPEEGTGAPSTPNAPATPAPKPGSYVPTRVPSVFDPIAKRSEFSGTVRRYKIRFRGPRTPKGFRWLLRFDGVRRNAGVF